jgi:hypothetical protein
MFHVNARWQQQDEKWFSKTFESHEDTSKEALKDVTDQLFTMVSGTPLMVTFRFEEEPSAAYRQLRGCTSKKNYHSEQAAQIDADAMNRKRDPALPKEVPYKCEFCRMWHVGASKFKKAV